MDLGTIRGKVRANLGETEANADFWTTVDLNGYINDALTRFSREQPWPWLVTEGSVSVLAADEGFQLGEGIDFNRNVNFLTTPTGSTRPYLLRRITPQQGFVMRALAGSLTSPRPEWYYALSADDATGDADFVTQVRIVPVPSQGLDIDYQYYRIPAVLEDDTDVPDLPVEYHSALHHYAAARAWEQELTGAVKAQEQDSLYGYVLGQAKDSYANEAPDTPLIVGGRPPRRKTLSIGRWTDMRLPDTFGS